MIGGKNEPNIARQSILDVRSRGLSKGYEEDAIKHATDLYNQIAAESLHLRTPVGALLGTALKISSMQVFGCMAYAHIHKETHVDQYDHGAELWLYLGNMYGLY